MDKQQANHPNTAGNAANQPSKGLKKMKSQYQTEGQYTVEGQYKAEYLITASNEQGAHCSGGTEKSLTAAIAKARRCFGKGWKIRINLEDKVIKEWLIRK